MAELKTKRTTASVKAFLDAIAEEPKRKDAKAVAKLIEEESGEKPAMWGTSIVGYGSYKIPSGEWPIVGFSPRKANLTLYIMPGFSGYGELMKRLGKHKTGVGCLYLNKLADVDEKVLRTLVRRSVAWMQEKYA